MSAVLRFLSGHRAGQAVVIPVGVEMTGGRDGQHGLELPGNNVSRSHVRFHWQGESLVAENLSRVNALQVNGTRVRQRVLARWDMVVVGPNVLRVESLPGDQVGARPAEHPLLAALLEIQHLLAGEGEDQIRRALGILLGSLPATRLSFVLRDEAGDLHLGPLAVQGPEPLIPPSMAFARAVLAKGHPVLLEAEDTQDLSSTLREQAVRTVLGAPVMDGETPLGVLIAENFHEPRRLDHTHLRGLTMVARSLEAVFLRERNRTNERERLRAEAESAAARRVQGQLFVSDPAALPGPCRWAACHQPALELCGDFWDCAAHGNGVIWLVADVSGKGLPAALVVSMLKIGFKAATSRAIAPGALLAELHRLIRGEMPPAMFFTAVAVLVEAGGRMTYASVGHPAILLVSADGSPQQLSGGRGVLGNPHMKLADTVFAEGTVVLQRGDRLALCTDGLTEASDGTNPEWGESGLLTTLASMGATPFAELIPGILAAADAYRAGRIHDDVTLVVGEYL